MKVKEGIVELEYLLDAGDGRWSKSRMPAGIAEEIAQRGAVVELTGPEGFGLRVDDMRFPEDAFEWEDADMRPEPKKPARRRRRG